MSSEGKYYILKCPFCDGNITKVMEEAESVIECPMCGKESNIYTLFGYNMWLAENGKAKTVKKRPLKDVKNMRKENEEIMFEYDSDDYDYDEDALADDYLQSSHLMQKRPKIIHEIMMFNADVCMAQYRYLTHMGFTRPEAIELLKKLIEQNLIL